MTIAKHPFELFDARYTVSENGCWEWTGTIGNHGYGWFYSNYSGCHWQSLAHRASWEMHNGSIGNLDVLHKCDNTKCVNPDHLFLGTHADNMQDCSAKNRFNDRSGINNARAILNPEKAFEIRWLAASGWRQKKLAEQYGVSLPTIQKVLSREIWKPECHD